MNEKDLDKLLSLDEDLEELKEKVVHRNDEKHMDDGVFTETIDKSDISLSRKLKKAVDKQINRKVFRGIILTVLAGAVILFVTSLLFDSFFYNPMKPSRYVKEAEEGYMVHSDFHFLMDIYTGLHFAGKTYWPLESQNEKEGFGSYHMYAKIQDIYEPLHIDGRYNTVFEINQNRYSVEALTEEHHLSRYVWDFYNDSKWEKENDYVREMLDMDEKRMAEIEKLPESAVIYANVCFDEVRNLKDALDFIRSYPDSDFGWIAMDSDVQVLGGTFDGIRLTTNFGYALTEETNEIYPNLILEYSDGEVTEEQLEQCYLSRLQILYDNPEFLSVVEGESGVFNNQLIRKREQIKRRLDEINTEGLWSIGLYGRITKEDFLAMVESGEITYANIKDAKLSVLSK